MKHSKWISALLALVLVAMVGQPIFAQKAFLKKVKELHPDLDKNVANCLMCHTFSKEKKEHADKKNINSIGKLLQDHPAMKTVINQKDGDDHKFTDEEMANVEKALKAIAPDKAALEKLIAEKK